MSKPILTALAVLFLTATLSAQTLFTYGDDTVSVRQFLSAYNKNNTSGAKNAAAMQQYLDLYILSRLKIKEAKDLGYDTLPHIEADLQSMRAQMTPATLADEASMDQLVSEALLRSKKDIRLAHIFIAGGTDTLTARNRAEEAHKKLLEGAPFAAIAKAYSEDPSVKVNGGDAGFITVFTLPYMLENLIYATAAGKITPVYHSKTGYHIFKNMGERKAAGKIKAAQILIAYPPDASAAIKTAAKRKADSLYNRLIKGDNFGKLATAFSNDVISAASGGVMPEMSVGQYDPIFEEKVYALTKGGTFTKPFATSHGWHIVKYISRVPVSAAEDAATMQKLRENVASSDRITYFQDALARRVIKEAGLTVLPFKKEELWLYSDSVFNRRTGTTFSLRDTTGLLKIGNTIFTTQDWGPFAQTALHKVDGSGSKSYNEVWESFIPHAALEYYKAHMEDFNPGFRAQLEEFKDGNLFFEIMQRKIWGPAQADSAALLQYYNRQKAKYTWGPSAEAVIFYASDASKASAFRKELAAKPAAWKNILANYAENITADHNRFELSGIPNAGTAVRNGAITAPLLNKADGTFSFAYIINVMPKVAPRNFAEARGLVTTDYQAQLEKEWNEALLKKYPVIINSDALKRISQ